MIIFDDCIAVALGGNGCYDRTLTEHQYVALFMTPHVGMQLEGEGPGGRNIGQAPGPGGNA
ncbi:MAG: hypothetical protein NTY37_06110 [Methanothrix sp.]|nr:hypothetical protein [Methanothrix sp.]